MVLLFVVIYFGVDIVVVAVDFALMFLDWFSCWLFFAIAECCFCVVGLCGLGLVVVCCMLVCVLLLTCCCGWLPLFGFAVTVHVLIVLYISL